ncbi:MAG: hypothetical protein ACKVW3_00540 [Phycisphaerales bacterium]
MPRTNDDTFLPPTVEPMREYVAGFPAWVAVTIQTKPGTTANRRPVADVYGIQDCFDIELFLKDKPEKAVRAHKSFPMVDEHIAVLGERIVAGEPRRMLFDMSPLLGPGLAPAAYVCKLSYANIEAAYPAPPFAFTLRAPTDAERDQLSTHAADRAQFASWADWIVGPPKGPVVTASLPKESPLRFAMVLRRASYGPDEPTVFDLKMLDGFDPPVEPEAKAIGAEVLKIRGDAAGYASAKAATLARAPGLAWWFRILDGGGRFAMSRRQVP